METTSEAIVIRVRAAPEGGRATEEARRALADALGMAPAGITLRRGPRSREKVYEVAGVTREQALQRLRPRWRTPAGKGRADAPTCYPSPP